MRDVTSLHRHLIALDATQEVALYSCKSVWERGFVWVGGGGGT